MNIKDLHNSLCRSFNISNDIIPPLFFCKSSSLSHCQITYYIKSTDSSFSLMKKTMTWIINIFAFRLSKIISIFVRELMWDVKTPAYLSTLDLLLPLHGVNHIHLNLKWHTSYPSAQHKLPLQRWADYPVKIQQSHLKHYWFRKRLTYPIRTWKLLPVDAVFEKPSNFLTAAPSSDESFNIEDSFILSLISSSFLSSMTLLILILEIICCFSIKKH
jgi:hypothetical protein